ncbi:MAG TPA: hypothetical protein VKE40_10505 [Gemmataceae bacterium]|nr:hypothetical protein [Gemmataceae bacterium]
MKDRYDPWYVRLPDGRTIKAKSTTSVRHHVEAGHIPLNSMVRRDPDEEWVALVWVAEFADLGSAGGRTLAAHGAPASAPPADARSGVSARLDPMRLQTVGVRGLIDELIAALDSTLTRSKMVPAIVAGVVLYLGMFLIRAGFDWALDSKENARAWAPVVAEAAFAILVLSILNAILARLTHTELATMRPAQLRAAFQRFGSYTVPTVVANAIVAGGGLGFLFLLQRVPGWTQQGLSDAGMAKTAQDVVFAPILVLVILLAVLAWLVIGLCWLLTAAIVVEESSWLAGIREWRQLLKEHFGRILVYEGLTTLLGVAISLPLILAVNLALHGRPALMPAWPVEVSDGDRWVTGTIEAAMHGLTAAPLLALLAVANVFIYLNLRYEQSPGR